MELGTQQTYIFKYIQRKIQLHEAHATEHYYDNVLMSQQSFIDLFFDEGKNNTSLTCVTSTF